MIRVESIRIALAGILHNRMRSALTMLGMLIGVGSVILLVAVGTGSSQAVQKSIEGLGTNLLQISPQAGGFGGGFGGGGGFHDARDIFEQMFGSAFGGGFEEFFGGGGGRRQGGGNQSAPR